MTNIINIVLILFISSILLIIPVFILFNNKKQQFTNYVFKDSDKNIIGTIPNYVKYPYLYNIKNNDFIFDNKTNEIIIPKGKNGPIGPIGIKGPVGEKGDIGYIGKTADGIQGSSGLKGLPGNIGIKGSDKIGSIGDKGLNGDNGNRGLEGNQGHIGIKGINGDKGELGDNNYILGEKGITYDINDIPNCINKECIPGVSGKDGILEKDPMYMLSINKVNNNKDLDIYGNNIEYKFNNIIIDSNSKLCIDNNCIDKNDFSKLHKHLFSDCSCINGIAKTYEDGCSRIKEDDCKSCNDGYYMKNSKCNLNKCICKNGVSVSNSLCEYNNQYKCDSCYKGYSLLNKKCIKNICICENGIQHDICDVDNLEKCKSCNKGYIYLNNFCYNPIIKNININKSEKTKINLNDEINDINEKILIETIIFNISGEYISNDNNIGALHMDIDSILLEFKNLKNIIIESEAYITGAYGKGSIKGYSPILTENVFYMGYNGGNGADGHNGGPAITFKASKNYKDKISIIINDKYERIIGGFPSLGGNGGNGGIRDIYLIIDNEFDTDNVKINDNDDILEICYDGICYNTKCNFSTIKKEKKFFISYQIIIDKPSMVYKINDTDGKIYRYYMTDQLTNIKLQDSFNAQFGGGVIKANIDNNKDNPFIITKKDSYNYMIQSFPDYFPDYIAGNIYKGSIGNRGKNGHKGIKIKTNNNIRYTYNSN